MRPRQALAVLAVAVVGVAAGCATDRDRAAGITERWLQAVSDQGRDNLFTVAETRASEFAEPGLGEAVLPPPGDRPDDERLFEDLEIGEATTAGDTARVPFRVTRRRAGDDTDELAATAVLRAAGRSWQVVAVDDRRSGELVPSEGGERPATAGTGHWLAAVALGVVVTVLSVALIEAQPRGRRGPRAPPHPPASRP